MTVTVKNRLTLKKYCFGDFL